MTLTLRHLTLAAAVALLCGTASAASAETLVVKGSATFNATLMPQYREDIEAVSGYRLEVVPTKSIDGLTALLAGQADLAMISSPLESEIELLKETRPDLRVNGLQSFLIHHTRVSFAVHPDNPVRATRWNLLRRVFSGDLSNWKQLGGRDQPIRVICVRDRGVLMSVEKQLMRGDKISPRNLVEAESGRTLPLMVAKDPGALGIAQLAEVKRHKLPEILLPVDIEQPLALVTLGPPTPAMYKVIDAARRVVAGQLD
jgi:phosphate transport system substrate-binding protein